MPFCILLGKAAGIFVTAENILQEQCNGENPSVQVIFSFQYSYMSLHFKKQTNMSEKFKNLCLKTDH